MDPNAEMTRHLREPHPMERPIDRSPTAKVWPSRRGRPAHLRISTSTATQNVREFAARMKAPGVGASLRDVAHVVNAIPLGRHGFLGVPGTLANIRAHREFFAVVIEQVAA